MKQKSESFFIWNAIVFVIAAFVFFYLSYVGDLYFIIGGIIFGFIALYFVEEFFRFRGHMSYPVHRR